MINAVKKAVISFFIIVISIVLFIVIFPMVYKPGMVDPAQLEIAGDFLQLDNGIDIHYVEKGEGGTLMLVHGFTSNLFSWNEVMPELSSHYRVIALDLPGYGFSDKPEDVTYDYKLFSDSIKQFLDTKGIGKLSIAGNSMGGGTSIRFTLDHPGMVEKLILVDSAGVKFEHSPILTVMFGTPGLNNFIFSIISEGLVKRSLKTCCYYNDDAVTDERAHLYTLPFRTEGALNAASKTVMQNDFGSLESELGNIQAPTLIVWGEKDLLIPATAAGKFNRLIPDSKLVMIEKCGHMPQEEKPAETTAAFIDFLE